LVGTEREYLEGTEGEYLEGTEGQYLEGTKENTWRVLGGIFGGY